MSTLQGGPRPYINTNGLILHLDAGNTASYPGSGSTWTDLSGNGYNGTLTNGPTFNSANGGSIVFDGTDDYVLVPNNLTFSTFMTVDIWFRSIKGTRHHIINVNSSSTANSFNFNLNDNGYTLWVYWNGSGTNSLRYTTPSLSDGVIRNLTFVHDNTINNIYINGILLGGASVTGTQTFTNVSGSIYIGAADNQHYTQGNVYNTRIYTRALSDKEVFQNYYALKSRFGL